MLLCVETDNDNTTYEYYLVTGDYRSDEYTFYDVTVYLYQEHYSMFNNFRQLEYVTTTTATAEQLVVDTQQYIVYSSFDNYPHLREEVTSNARFAQSCTCFAALFGCVLLCDFVRLFRARIGGGSA